MGSGRLMSQRSARRPWKWSTWPTPTLCRRQSSPLPSQPLYVCVCVLLLDPSQESPVMVGLHVPSPWECSLISSLFLLWPGNKARVKQLSLPVNKICDLCLGGGMTAATGLAGCRKLTSCVRLNRCIVCVCPSIPSPLRIAHLSATNWGNLDSDRARGSGEEAGGHSNGKDNAEACHGQGYQYTQEANEKIRKKTEELVCLCSTHLYMYFIHKCILRVHWKESYATPVLMLYECVWHTVLNGWLVWPFRFGNECCT